MPTHTDIRNVPYTAKQMYDLVADVMAYPEFIPWCEAMRMKSNKLDGNGAGEMIAEMIVKYKLFRERFKSRVILHPEKLEIEADYIDGPFRNLHNHWRFKDLAEGGSTIHFKIDFEFRNFLLQKVAMQVFDRAFAKMSGSFLERADVLYG